MSKMRTKQFDGWAVKDLGDNRIECIIATDEVDRMGEILDIKGLDTTNYEKNPVVLLFHDSQDFPVGKSVSLKKVKDKATGVSQLIGITEFAADIYEKAELAYKMCRDGFLSAKSIGFMPTDYMIQDDGTLVWTKSEMLEYSIVPIPANPSCLSKMKSMGYADEDRSWFKEVSDKVNKSIEGEKEEIAETAEKKDMLGDTLQLLQKSVSVLESLAQDIKADSSRQETKTNAEVIKEVRVKKLYKLKKAATISSTTMELLFNEIQKQIN